MDEDPVGNAVVWDRVYQQPGFQVYVDKGPPRAVLAVSPFRRPEMPRFVGLHPLDAATAGTLCEVIPAGPALFFLTEEFALPFLEARDAEFEPRPAWLFSLAPADFADHSDERVRRLDPAWSGFVAKLWNPDWPAEPYVRSRIEGGPTAAVYVDGKPVAWAVTHMVTDRVGIIGMVHVVDEHRRKGLARSVVAAISRELMAAGKVPALHVYLDNAPSLALFPTLGFRKVKRQVWGDAVFR